MKFKESYDLLTVELSPLFDGGEIHSIARILYEDLFGLLSAFSSNQVMTDDQKGTFDRALARLLEGEPIDYITGVREFYGRRFHVNDSVLIPRQETEELVAWVIEDLQEMPGVKILDIGTGSGCIPITIDLETKSVNDIVGIDVSEAALLNARRNNESLQADVRFYQNDVLHDSLDLHHNLDVIVSNPPYILTKERSLMNRQVFDHEPEIALFTKGNDPLIFYKRINQIALSNLRSGGHLYYEISALHKELMMSLMDADGFIDVEVRKDMSGNWRMIKATKS